MHANFLGSLFTLFAGLFFASAYGCYQTSETFVSSTTVIFLQNLISWSLLLPFTLKNGLQYLVTPNFKLILLRSLFGLGVLSCISFAVQTTTLTNVTLLNSAAPLFIPLLSFLWLKEKINHALWPSLILGFMGIAIILHPEKTAIQIGLFAALASGILSALLTIAIRKLAKEPFNRMIFYYFLVFWIGTLPFFLFNPENPPPIAWLYIFLAALFMIAGQFSLTFALRKASPQIVAPCMYSIVIFSLLIDAIFWHITPPLLSIFGILLVILGGAITARLQGKKKAIILVEPIGSGALFKQTAHAMGYQVIAIYLYSKNHYLLDYHTTTKNLEDHCDQIFWGNDLVNILLQIKRLPLSIQGCIAGNEGGVEFAEQISLSLKLPCNPKGSAKALKDKGLMREVLKKSALFCPDFIVCSSQKELETWMDAHEFPLVIKQPKGAASSQVYICKNSNELISHFQEILSSKSFYETQAKNVVAEEYIDGIEYIVDTFSDGEKVHITDIWRYTKENTATVNNRCVYTISMPLEESPITTYAKKIVNLFQVEKGASHIEIKDDPRKGPTLIEIGGRLAGAGIPEMVKNNSNCDLYRATIEVFTKGKTKIPDPIIFKKHMAIVHFSVNQRGIVQQILGIDQIQKLPSYVQHKLHIKPQDFVEETTNLPTHPGVLFLAHSNRHQLLQDIEKARELFVLDFAP